MNETALDDAKTVIRLFENDLLKYMLVPVDSNILKKAKELTIRYGTDGLRTLDSIQLACAVETKDRIYKYFTSDKLLNTLFEKEKLPLYLPQKRRIL